MKNIEKVRTGNDKMFIQPTAKTVKKDKSVIITLDAAELNNAIVEDKYQMPNMDHLGDLVAKQPDKTEREARFTSPDMQ